LIRLTDTLRKRKTEFIPVEKGKVKMYTCGPTVYNTVHIGNARPAVVFDSLRRYFEYKGYRVTYVMNFTDIDDKIINRMKDEGWDYDLITTTFIREYLRDMQSLGVKPANYHPRTSHFVPETIDFIEKLVDKGFAYAVEGEIFYNVKKFPGYGELSHRKLEDMLSGARIEVDRRKKNPGDFTLWKPAKADEPYWNSPWGKGRPGWHIECSVMSTTLLGSPFDIHAGGNDLIFPHHENEKAQSESCLGGKFANYWLHNGMLQMNGSKMAKSVGNIISIRDAVSRYGKDAVRMFLFSTQFRSPIDYSEDRFEEWRKGAGRVNNALLRVEEIFDTVPPFQQRKTEWLEEKRKLFEKYLDDDFNTPRVLSLIFDIVKEMNATADKPFLKQAYWLIKGEWADVLGLFTDVPVKTKTTDTSGIDKIMELIIHSRETFRKNKMYEQADKIRDGLNEAGIKLLDTPDGTKWQQN